MKTLKLITLFSTLLSLNLLADTSTTIEIPGTSLKLESTGHKSNTYLTFGYKNAGLDLSHNETASSGSLYTLNESNSVNTHMLDMGVTKEFLKHRLFSISLLANAGYGKGKSAINNSDKNNFYTDEVEDLYLGGGISVNFNQEAFGIRIQPFFATQYQFSNNTYNSNYGQTSDRETIYQIETTNDIQRLQHTLGIRFFNPDKSLLSFINLDFQQNLIKDLKTTATQGSTNIVIKDPTVIDENPIKISVGFGFML